MEDSRKRFGLSANERIKSKKDFEQLFSSGRTIYSSDKKIKALFLITSGEDIKGIKMAPVVSKKAGNAVWRNKVKRLIKESYRLNKEILSGLSLKKTLFIRVAFSPYSLNQVKNKKLELNEIMPGVVEILLKIKSALQ